MTRTLIIAILLLIAKAMSAQIDSSMFLDVYWESYKIERNGKFYHFSEKEKSYMSIRLNGTFIFVFSKESLKKGLDDKWKYDKINQSLTVFSDENKDLPPMVFKIVEATQEELILISDFKNKNDKVYYKKIELE
jgi:hypothetical protein